MKPRAKTATEDEEREKQAERTALSRRFSKSNLIRESVSRFLKDMAPAKEPATTEAKPEEVGISDLSDMHDRYAARIRAQRRTKKK